MRKKLRIAQIAPLWIRVPPEKYGGVEQVVYNLSEELVKRGHKVTLFASGDSKTSAKLKSIKYNPLVKSGIPWTDNIYNLMNISTVLEKADQFDIIHSHVYLYDLFFSKLLKKPFVFTIHNPLYYSNNRKDMLKVFKKYSSANFVTVSRSQRKSCPFNLSNATTIYNGININRLNFNEKPGDHFIWIARMDKFKGIESAIRAARGIGAKLILAGRIDDEKRDYFNEKVKPLIKESKGVRFIGEVSSREKSKFFGEAKALLYPIDWEEPFGLVVAEAMACGTPVIAYKRGAVSEIVKDGKTGFVVKNLEEMKMAMKKIDEISRKACRKRVENMFSVEKMVDGYEKLYARLLKKD